MIDYIITLIMGIIMGFVLDRKFFKKEKEKQTVEEAIKLLRGKNYHVNINVIPEKEK